MTGNEGRWERDPYQRAELRWHDGTGWTSMVSDRGVTRIESPGETPLLATLETPATLTPGTPPAVPPRRTNGWLVTAGVVQVLVGLDLSRVLDGSSYVNTFDLLFGRLTQAFRNGSERFGAGAAPSPAIDVGFVVLGALFVLAGMLCARGKVRAGVFGTVACCTLLLVVIGAGVGYGLAAGTFQTHFVPPETLAGPVVAAACALAGLRRLRRG